MRKPKPIVHFEVSEKNKKLRQFLIIVLLAIAVVAITTGVMSVLNKETGWQEVEVSTEERNCSPNFLFQYQFSGSGANATALHKQISALYTDACVKSYQLFTAEEAIQGVNNVYYLNSHPNEEVQVEALLYHALEKMASNRYLYLGPVYAYYDGLLFNAGEEYLQEQDPRTNQEAREYLAQIAGFANDPNAVQLELLGDNRVKLCVSQAYLAFAQEHEIDRFVDFHYMTNAFIIDYLADTMNQAGYTHGYIVSADGYTRNLDKGNTYNFNIFDRVENLVYPAGVMEYRGPVSLVFLKNYPTAESDAYYRASGDHFVHVHADPADGLYKSSRNNWVGYSYEMGCADVLLRMLPSFVSEEAFTAPEGIFSIWCENGTVFYNDPAITIKNLLRQSDVSYRAECVN